MTRLRVNVKARALFSEADVMAAALDELQELMDSKVMPHFVEVAKARAPKGQHGPAASFGRQITGGTNKRSFKRIAPRDASEFDRNSPDFGRAARLASLDGTRRARFFREAFGKSTKDPNITKLFKGVGGDFSGRSPTEIQFRNNTLKGAFTGQRRHEHLAGSISYDGSKRVGNSIVASATAHAPHASAIHDGFTHRGGPDHQGSASRIPGRPFFDWATPNIEDDFNNL